MEHHCTPDCSRPPQSLRNHHSSRKIPMLRTPFKLTLAASCLGFFIFTGRANRTVDHLCTFPDETTSSGPTTVTDFSDGVSSDGRGPYVANTDGVGVSLVGSTAVLTLGERKESPQNPRRLTVNLNRPIPGGGGVPLGIITDHGGGLVVQWRSVENALQNLHSIPVGQTVTAAQMNVLFSIDGHAHILQMGPQAAGHCHYPSNLVNGTGTSSGTIYRASTTKWVMDLPTGSVGRLFNVEHDAEHAVDKGLYYLRLHYEIGN